jgi:hypothetical protein
MTAIFNVCAECGKAWPKDPDAPPSDMSWCSPACHDAWYAARPEEAAKWIAVSDMSALQRAELEAVLGLGARA